ncbi:MAG: alpha/beta fold hydrolase [Alphaproteobacteria bacterium]|nr:alpha/beta fold hydrolase [Alphaproteobacteria bacterium]
MTDFFNSHGFSIAYDDVGPHEKRPMVLLHGFASNRTENWRRVGWYGAFERQGLRCIAMDWRGHGESAKPHEPEAYGREALLDDLFGLLDHLDLDSVNLMGYSMGARLALAAVLTQPQRFKNLIIGGVGARLFEPSPSGNPLAEAMECEDPSTLSEPLLKGFRQFADAQGDDRLALAACARGRGGEEFTREALATIRSAVLVIAGTRDELAGNAQVLADVFMDGRAVTLPGCDHFSAIPHALYKSTVFDFLDGTLP